MSTIFKDNSAEVINDLNSRINRALYVIGLAVMDETMAVAPDSSSMIIVKTKKASTFNNWRSYMSEYEFWEQYSKQKNSIMFVEVSIENGVNIGGAWHNGRKYHVTDGMITHYYEYAFIHGDIEYYITHSYENDTYFGDVDKMLEAFRFKSDE